MALAINHCFENEGLPRRIKIDNGVPLVFPHESDLPTLTVLWWVGLGIEVIKNKPRCPQQNGTVEGLQGVCFRWADPANCATAEQLQQSINEAIRIQRRVYLLPKKKHQTRQQLYPQLNTNPRKFSVSAFDFNRVKNYLAAVAWERRIRKNGSIKFYATEIYVAQSLAGRRAFITFDPEQDQWVIRDDKGALLKTSTKALVTQQAILDHVNMSKNLGDNFVSLNRVTT